MTLRTITTMAPSIGRFFIMPLFFATAPPPRLRFCFLSFYLLKDTSLAIDNNGYAYEWRWRWQRLLGRETTGWNKEGIKSRDAGMYFFVTFLLRCPGFYWNWTLSYLQAPNTCAGPVLSTMARTPSRRSRAVATQSWGHPSRVRWEWHSGTVY